MRGRAAFSEQLAEGHLSDQVLPSFEELRVVLIRVLTDRGKEYRMERVRVCAAVPV